MKINVRNEDQKALLELELLGQISDGYWENSIASRTWEDVEVCVDPNNVGVDFAAFPCNFTSKKLLDVVKTRMVLYVRLAREFGNLARDLETLFISVNDDATAAKNIIYIGAPDDISSLLQKGNTFWTSWYNRVKDYLKSPKLISIAETPLNDSRMYSLKDLRRDLNDLNKIQRTLIKPL